MWCVVCIGRRLAEHPHRVVDRGPLLPQEQRARAIAAWLRSTGLYEHVTVERRDAVRTAVASQPQERHTD